MDSALPGKRNTNRSVEKAAQLTKQLTGVSSRPGAVAMIVSQRF